MAGNLRYSYFRRTVVRVGRSKLLGFAPRPYLNTVLDDTPLVYWRLGDSSGTVTVDSSGNARDGTYSGTPTLGSAGALVGDANTSVTFDGIDDCADIGWAAWQDVASLSCEAWIKTSTGGVLSIGDRDSPTANRRTFQFRLNAGKLEFVRIVNAAGSTAVVTGAGTTNVNNGAWHHCVATYDGSNIRIYVDGLLESTTAATGGINQPGGSTTFSVGVNRSVVGGAQWFVGQIDEYEYYGTALSAAKVLAHYRAGTSGSGVIDWTVSRTDDEALTDSAVLDRLEVTDDTEGLADAASFAVGEVVTDAEGLTDSATVENGKILSQTDTEGLTDSASIDQGEGATDPEGLTDTQALSQSKVVTDSENLTDSATVENGKLLTQSDTENLTDSAAFALGDVNADTEGLTDAAAQSLAKVVTDGEGLTDSALVENAKTVTATDTEGLTDSVSIVLGAVQVDLEALTDAAAFVSTKVLADLLGLTDSATVTLTGPIVDDPNPITVTIRDTGHTTTLRAERARQTVGTDAATTVREPRSRLTQRPSTSTTAKEN